MKLIPFPITRRSALILNTADGCIARAKVRSRAIDYLSARMNQVAVEMVRQGISNRAVTEQMIAFFDAVEASVNAMGSQLPKHVRIAIPCIGMDIVRDRSAGRDKTG